MPSSIGQSSAPLGPLTLVGPGFLGENTQLSSTTLGPEWAVSALNCVFDDANRLAARFGWDPLTATAASGSPNFQALFQYVNLSGTSIIVSAGGNKIYTGTSALTDLTGALTPSANNWKFVNFNGNCYGIQIGHPLIQYTGAGNFTATAAASGTVPDGNELLSAFGRLWGSDANGQKLKYCGLLDATNWGGAGAGSFDFTNVWPSADSIVGLAAFNNLLVVFGSNNILLMTDGTGSVIGMNPTNMFVQDAIHGIGCLARDSVQNINGDDLVFLSYSGVQSLRRVIQQKSNPLRDISKNVRSTLLGNVAQETATKIKSTFNPFYGFYLLILPTPSKIYCFDTKLDIPDSGQINTETSAGAWRVTEWDNFIPTSVLTLKDGKTLYCGKVGKIFSYGSVFTDNTVSFNFLYTSGWLILNEEVRDRLKFLKRLAALVSLSSSSSITFKWAFDFNEVFTVVQKTITTSGAGGEWGIGEFGIAEFGSSSNLYSTEVPASGSGQFIKIAVQIPVSAGAMSLQQLQLFAKIGRIK